MAKAPPRGPAGPRRCGRRARPDSATRSRCALTAPHGRSMAAARIRRAFASRAIWRDAQVRVSCWIYESFYVLQRHFDPIDFSGKVDPCGDAVMDERIRDV